MSQTSPSLALPYIQPAQAQKHVTHNEALRILDAVTQLSVLSATAATPPSSPTVGDRYIVGTAAAGSWSGQDGNLAIWVDGTWQFFVPNIGWRADIASTGAELRFDGTAWQAAGDVDLQNVPLVGVGTSADAVNKLSVSAEATLLNNAGAGHQLKLNKSAVGDTASLLFQTGFSGRAEMGTAGEDNFAIKVSADGGTFNTALRAEAGTGAVQFPSGQAFFEDVFIADDSVWSVTIPWSDPARILMWLSAEIDTRNFLFAITGTLAGAANFGEIFASTAGGLNYETGPLTGTTGTDGALSISIDVTGAAPTLFLENRLGNDQRFTLSTLGK